MKLSGEDKQLKNSMTILKYIKEIREKRIEIYTDKFEKDEERSTENNIVYKASKDPLYIKLIFKGINHDIAQKLNIKNVSIKIPVDKSNRSITLMGDNFDMELSSCNHLISIDSVNMDTILEGEYVLTIYINEFLKDVLVNSPEEIYDYPILDIEINQNPYNHYTGNINGILMPGGNKSILISEEGDDSYELFSDLSYYKKNILNCFSSILTLLDPNSNKKYLIYYNGGLFELIKVVNNGFNVKKYMDEEDGSDDVITMKNIGYRGDLYTVNKDSIICDNNDVWYNNKVLSKKERKLLGKNYKDSFYYKFITLMNIIQINFENENYSVCVDYSDKLNSMYEEIKDLPNANIIYLTYLKEFDKNAIQELKNIYSNLKRIINKAKKEVKKED